MKRLVLLSFVLLFGVIGQAQEKKDLKLNGDVIEAKLYHDSGELAQTGNYTTDGKLEGKWISYDRTGSVTAVAYYDNGDKVGTWTFYQGDLIKEVSYMDSKIAKVENKEVQNGRIVVN